MEVLHVSVLSMGKGIIDCLWKTYFLVKLVAIFFNNISIFSVP